MFILSFTLSISLQFDLRSKFLMRIKQEVLITSLFLFIVSECDHLTDWENYDREQSCGKEPLATPGGAVKMAFPSNSWLVKVALVIDGNIQSDFALGSFISKRHILTSSQPVMNDDGNWIWNVTAPIEYFENTNHARVPLDSINNVKLLVTRDMSNKNDLPAVNNVSVYVLRVKEQKEIDRMRSPMIIELEQDVDVKFACVSGSGTVQKVNDVVHVYGFNPSERTVLVHREKTITGFDNTMILVDEYYADKDRGGPMVKDVNGSSTILGVTASSASNKVQPPNTHIFNGKLYRNDICFVSGICEVPTGLILSTMASKTKKTKNCTKSAKKLEDEEFLLVWGDDEFSGSRGSGWIWLLGAFLTVKLFLNE